MRRTRPPLCSPGHRRGGAWLLALTCGVLWMGEAIGQAPVPPVVVQEEIPLRKGWNAVFLAVDPRTPAPGALFDGLPVERVAAYFPSRTPVEFIQDPASPSWKPTGWRFWYAPSQPEAALSDLSAVIGGQGYLVYANAAVVWRVEGEVRLRRFAWQADSYNLVGFPVDPAQPPTFAAWFGGSAAHQSSRRPLVYDLSAEGHWIPVERTERTSIRPYAAYWVFCQGGSDYQGPLDVAVPRGVPGLGLAYGDQAESLTLQFRNRTGSPLAFILELDPAGAVPLSYERRVPNTNDRVREPLTGVTGLGPLEAAGELTLRIALDRAALASGDTTGLLTVRDDLGGRVRIPVSGRLP